MNATTFSRPLAWVDTALQWMIRLVWLNLWWLALTLLGGVLLGFGPATVAAHTVSARWIRGDRSFSVGSTMWREWRRHWPHRVLVSLLTTGMLVALAATWWFAGQQAPIPGAVARALSTVGLLVMAALLPHLAWVCDRTELNTGRTVLAALAAGLSRPLLTVALLVIGLGWPAVLVLSGWPGLLPVFGVSVPMLASAWCVHRVFPRTVPAPSTDHPSRTDDWPVTEPDPATSSTRPHSTPMQTSRPGTPTVPAPSPLWKGTDSR